MDPATGRFTAEFFAAASDPQRMRAVMGRHLRLPGGPPIEVVACQIGFKRRGPPRNLFEYHLTLRDPTSGGEWTQVVSGVAYGGQRTLKAWKRLQQQHMTAPANGRTLARAAYVPELDMLLQVFPFDHQLPALEPLMAGPLPGLLDSLLSRFGPGEWQLEAWDAESMRYRVDLRASVRLTVRAQEATTGSREERRFFAKIYGSREQVERAWGVQRDVAAALAAGNAPFGIASLVAYLPEEQLLVQDEVPGTSLLQVLLAPDAEKAIAAVRRSARSVAAMHCLDVTPPVHRVELGRTDPQRLRRNADTVRAARPDLAAAVSEVEAGILAGLAAIGELPSVPIHGDLKPLHVVFDNERVVLLDLDKFAAGEPMLDVTAMLIHLGREKEGRQANSRALVRTFVEEYLAHVPAAWKPRLAPHYAWALLEQASRDARALDEAHAVLAGRAWSPDRVPDRS